MKASLERIDCSFGVDGWIGGLKKQEMDLVPRAVAAPEVDARREEATDGSEARS